MGPLFLKILRESFSQGKKGSDPSPLKKVHFKIRVPYPRIKRLSEKF
jgi:hypothetical protein